MESLLQDLWYGARMLRKNAGFTAIAVLTLALGIGANTAIFSIVDFFLFRPLPVVRPHELAFLTILQKGGYSNGFSNPDFLDIRNQTSAVFSDVASFDFGQDGLTVDGKTQPILTGYVSGNFFRMLGIHPFMGRFLLPSEGAVSGADPVLVLSYSSWQARFGGDPSVIGKKVAVNGQPVTIIGVAPKGFLGPTTILETQGYLPLGMQTRTLEGSRPADFFSDRSARSMLLLARLQNGVSLKRAQSELDVVSRRLSQDYSKTDEGMTLHVWPLGPSGMGSNPAANPLPTLGGLFLGLAFLVLVLACVNVANMLLVRAASREREMAVRAALGAARSRLIRQLLSESLLLALLGCVAGIGAGLVVSHALSSVDLMISFPVVLDFHFDWRVFAYAFGMALVTGILAGIVPALRASRANLNETLHQGDRSATGGRQRLRSALVMTQVAGSLALLVVAGLFTRSMGNAHMADLGFDPRQVLNLTMDPQEIGYNEAQGQEFYRQLLARMNSMPGIQFAALAATVPLGEMELGGSIDIEGHPAPSGQPLPSAGANWVSPQYFAVMRIPLLRGRTFTDADEQNSQGVAIINEAMAQRYWPNEDAIGKHFTSRDEPQKMMEVVGIVKNSTTGSLTDVRGPYYYAPFMQHYSSSMATLQIRTAGAPESMTQATVQVIQSLAPAMPVYRVQTMSKAIKSINGLLLFQFGAVLAASLGVLGLVLAIVGVYGVVSYSASRRTREIGIRMALGARPAQVLAMVCTRGMMIIIAGLAVGVVAALAIGRVVGSFLIGISASDPLTYVSVSLALLSIGFAACYIPSRRAAKVDPMIALRHE